MRFETRMHRPYLRGCMYRAFLGQQSGRCLSCDNRRTESCRRAVSPGYALEHGCIAPTMVPVACIFSRVAPITRRSSIQSQSCSIRRANVMRPDEHLFILLSLITRIRFRWRKAAAETMIPLPRVNQRMRSRSCAYHSLYEIILSRGLASSKIVVNAGDALR